MPRVQCRLHGRVTRGREKVRVRIVDVSEGGLCLLSPVWLDPKKETAVAIEVPGRGTATVRVEIWHVRREKSRTSSGKVWIAGAMLRGADEGFARLLAAVGLTPTDPSSLPASSAAATPSTPAPSMSAASAGVAPSAAPAKTTMRGPSGQPASAPPGAGRPTASAALEPAAETEVDAEIDASEPRIFRLRCKAKGSPRTRVLSLAADSAEEAHKLASHDLGPEWDVLEILEA